MYILEPSITSRLKADNRDRYTWIRTAALTFKVLIERLSVTDIPEISDDITDYVHSQRDLQFTRNPSGDDNTGGLGEPKFQFNGNVFKGAWNRPQQDGPALRATAMVIHANNLLADAQGTVWASSVRTFVQNFIWPIVFDDLKHTERYWNQTSFDLWEEVKGSSFFTLSASHRALVEGMALGKTLGKYCEGCAVTAPQILCFLQDFWNGKHITANLNAAHGRSGIDTSSILSSIHTYDPRAGCVNSTFQPCSSRALANHKVVTDSFRPLYGINDGSSQNRAVGVGRYPEDADHGGNPWYVTTLAAAEQLYLARLQWQDQKQLTIDETSLPFFRDLLPTISIGTYRSRSASATFESVLSAVQAYADGYMAMVRKYTPPDGGLALQFDKNNGAPLSATDFTWSHAAFYTAANRRGGVRGPSWGSTRNDKPEAQTCQCNVHVTFNVFVNHPSTDNHVFVTGNVPTLGNWDPKSAREVREVRAHWIVENASYTGGIDLPASARTEYQYFMRNILNWDEVREEDRFRRYITTGACGTSMNVSDIWNH